MNNLRHQFVEFIPAVLEEGVLYISIEFGTVSHRCCCGCGKKVVTPLTPTDWRLTFDGETITLYPSIGNWQFPCRSHYWIRNSRVVWAEDWSKDKIETSYQGDQDQKARHYGEKPPEKPAPDKKKTTKKLWAKLRKPWW